MVEIPKKLLTDVNEVFDYFVRAGVGPCGCDPSECSEAEPNNRSCFAWYVAVRLEDECKKLRGG